MKKLLLFGAFALLIFNSAIAQNCFLTRSDVLNYVINQEFSSTDGSEVWKFGTKTVTVTIAKETKVRQFMFGNLSESGEGQILIIIDDDAELLSVSCKKKVVSFNGSSCFLVDNSLPFEVAEKDMDGKMNWTDATAACKALGNGWRLPTKEELLLMFEKSESIGGLKGLSLE
jgi:hypothetical protein